MTTKKISKPATKPATKPAFDSIESGKIIGASFARLSAADEIAAKATEAIQAQVKAMREAKITIGKSRATCSVASAIYDAMATVKASTRTVYLSLIRKAVNETGKFSMNATRDAKKAKAKAKGAKATGGNIVISLASGAEAKDAAAKLRAGFEKMRAANDGLASLAAFLVDALDEAGFPASK
jgi:hypothetical protein